MLLGWSCCSDRVYGSVSLVVYAMYTLFEPYEFCSGSIEIDLVIRDQAPILFRHNLGINNFQY